MYQKILVTGSTGFLGGYVTRELLKRGYYVKATGRNLNQIKDLNHSNLEKITADLSIESQCTTAIEGCDAIVHCAALASPWGKKSEFVKSNMVSTNNLTNLALAQNIKRFVHISTPSIYMGMKKQLNINEADLLSRNFTSDYALTKYEAEKIIDAATKKGLSTVTLRPQGLFGPKDNVLIPRILAANQKTGIPVFNNGQHLIDMTYIDNVVHAVMLSLKASDLCNGQKYNITNNEPVVFKSFLETLFKKLDIKPNFKKIPLWLGKLMAHSFEFQYKVFKSNTEPPITRYAIDALSTSRTLDISKAICDLNYKPEVSIEDGVDRFVHWWKTQ